MKMNASIKYSDQFYVYLWYAIVKTRKSVFGLKSDFEPPLAHSALAAGGPEDDPARPPPKFVGSTRPLRRTFPTSP